MTDGWQFWIDRGGTFTDIVARRPDGTLGAHKLLSENPEHYEDAAVEGMRRLLGVTADDPFPAGQVTAIKMGTTVATNALLERKGERTLLAITAGFADALFIGTQNRPRLFDLNIRRPDLLHDRVLEVPERLYADGTVETPLDEAAVRAGLKAAFDDGYRAVAVVLMHADRHPFHEARVAAIAREAGFTQVSASHEVIPLMKLIGRGDTTVADAYLSPILARYVDRIANKVGETRLLFMQSNGGLTDARRFRGKDAILSGPAGGAVGLAGVARLAGLDRVIGFDMGGTSTDVSHYAGTFERSFETTVAGVRLRAPMMSIHTVAAGGGSICVFDGLRFRVGPESAGADPGPACYRRGGSLTVTDCNVVLGRIQPHHFPRVFGPGGDEPLDAAAARNGFIALAREVEAALDDNRTPEDLTPESLAEGFLAIAVENMAQAIKTISVQRGYDVSKYTLVSFGGAGGQHACRVADALGMDRVLIHPLAGVLSAYGMGLADLRDIRQQTVEAPLDDAHYAALTETVEALATDAHAALEQQDVPAEAITVECRLHVKVAGSDTALPVPFGTVEDIAAAFAADHRRLFGFDAAGKSLTVEAAVAEASGGGAALDEPEHSLTEDAPTPLETVVTIAGGEPHDTPVFGRTALRPGMTVAGPALIAEANATTVIDPGWQAAVTARDHLLLSRAVARPKRTALGTDADPVMVEIFNSLFMSIAEQMGAALQNTAHSVNIKERLDFSCAVFDRDGNLVANAPHMPVHLGSMGESVRAVLAAHEKTMRPGDAFLTNAPYNGGTHLPDITVVAPVFNTSGERVFCVAARGHHADIGGTTPGSMPPDSHTIDEEGVLFDAAPLVRDGRFLEDDIRAALLEGPYPARNPEQNLADLRAQVAACVKGAAELDAMTVQFGEDVVSAYTGHVQDNAEEAVRRVIDTLEDGTFTAPMDDGGEIRVTVTVHRDTREATVDFTGTSPQRPSNYNAPAAVCRAAVLYVFRTLVADDIPMNEGCLKPLRLIVPEGSMLNPRLPAAVVAGNVETSQIICDALYGALGRLAASQGTMNNLTFGDGRRQYYETLCGGAGAGPDFDGADAVHTHMTNSRLTDPEVLEWRYPVLVERFAVRRGSGGQGKHRGGDGVVRRIRFLEPMTVAMLAGRRTTRPFGLNGGGAGTAGETAIVRADGTRETLSHADKTDVAPGDAIIVSTPGGGGFGEE